MTQQQIQKTTTPRKPEEVIEEMPAPVISETSTVTDELLDDIAEAIEITAAMSDDLLLDAVRAVKVQTVPDTGRSAFQSHQARAWTMGGSVD